jgi:hypothetical protein
MKSKQQALGRGKDWNYILDCVLNRPTGSTFLEVLNIANTVLKQHIVCEVTELMGQYDDMLELKGEPVKLVLATAGTFAKFGARYSSGGASRLLRNKTFEVAVFDEAQAYEIDQVVACVCSHTIRTALFAGDKNQSIVKNWPQWTRAPWFPNRQVLSPAPPKPTVRCVTRWTRTHPRTWDLPSVEKAQM